MITALSTPSSGRVLLDSNNTVIKLQSSNGQGYYFRAKIYINDVFFDEQGWSRSDAFTATKDLKKLLDAYFTPVFNSTVVGGISEQTHLIRKINITVEEYSFADEDLVSSLNLPVFYVMYNVVPESFSDTVKIKILGVDPEIMVISANGKLVIPFYVNAVSENISATLETGDGTAVDTFLIGSVQTGKKVFLLKANINSYNLNSSVSDIKVKINLGSHQVTKKVRVIHAPDYPAKEIAFMNNFGYYLYAYLPGKLETENSYSAEIYETADGKQKVSEINEESTFTINSGNLRFNEKAIIGMIATSVDVKLNIGINQASNRVRVPEQWVDLVPKTKKHLFYTDKQHTYNDELTFSMRKGTDVINTGMITVVPASPDIVITDTDVSGISVTVAYLLNNGFSTPSLRLQYRPVGFTSWLTFPVTITANPMVFTVSAGNYNIRLVDFTNPSNVSNTVTVTTS